MGSNLDHGFWGGAGHLRGPQWVTANCEQYPNSRMDIKVVLFSPRSGFRNCGSKRGLPVHWLPRAFTKGKVGKASTTP